MKFKELAYKSAGPVLEGVGIGYMIKGIVAGNGEILSAGFIALMGGILVSQRTRYITEAVDRLNKRISELEKKTK